MKAKVRYGGEERKIYTHVYTHTPICAHTHTLSEKERERESNQTLEKLYPTTIDPNASLDF